MTSFISPDASVEDGATIGEDCSVWDLAKIRSGAVLGAQCIVGRGAFIDAGVTVGDRCKIQNDALIYAPAQLDTGVFIGPAVVLTNDLYPRAITADGELKVSDDWVATGVTVERGASIGARSVVVAGCTVGAWSLVAAGAVVTKSVAAHALVAGVPARRIGWVGHAGYPLIEAEDGRWRCPQTKAEFQESDGLLEPLEGH